VALLFALGTAFVAFSSWWLELVERISSATSTRGGDSTKKQGPAIGWNSLVADQMRLAMQTRRNLEQRVRNSLGADLELGRWKAGDAVEEVLARYGEKHPIEIKRYGEVTVIQEVYFADYGPIRGEYEIIADQGRVKAAGFRTYPPLFIEDWHYVRVYFDAWTKEEWAAYYARYVQTVNSYWITHHWSRTSYGIAWWNKTLSVEIEKFKVLVRDPVALWRALMRFPL
jgi:hypothetical protein